MSDPELTLVIGEYNSSSGSLSAWLLLRLTGLPFEEIRVPLGQYETATMVRDYSPSGLLPVLIAGKLRIWDVLAIGEYLYEFDNRLWPDDPRDRALARAICAEIHGGFHDLFTFLPMDMVSRFTSPGMMLSGVEQDVERICAIWHEYRARNAEDGPFMFGRFTIVDAMMAPIASRLVTHGIELPAFAEDYVDSVMSWPDMALWQGHAAEENEEAATMPLDVISRECPTTAQPVVSSVLLPSGPNPRRSDPEDEAPLQTPAYQGSERYDPYGRSDAPARQNWPSAYQNVDSSGEDHHQTQSAYRDEHEQTQDDEEQSGPLDRSSISDRGERDSRSRGGDEELAAPAERQATTAAQQKPSADLQSTAIGRDSNDTDDPPTEDDSDPEVSGDNSLDETIVRRRRPIFSRDGQQSSPSAIKPIGGGILRRR